jgi:hypothetical protein
MDEDVVKRRVQPRLCGFAEFFGKAQTVTGDLWWEEERMDDGTVEVREDRAIRTDSNGLSESQTYTYEPNPNGERHWFRRRKNGIWEEVTRNQVSRRWNATGGLGLRIGEREEYRDPSF